MAGRTKWVIASAVVVLLVLAAFLYRSLGSPWWLDDSRVASEIQQIAATVEFPVSLPAWIGYLKPNRAQAMGSPHDGIEVRFSGVGLFGSKARTVRFVQTTDLHFRHSGWAGDLQTEEITIHGVTATFQYGHITTGALALLKRGENGRIEQIPMRADRAARIEWQQDGVMYLIEGRFVEPKTIIRMAESIRKVDEGQ